MDIETLSLSQLLLNAREALKSAMPSSYWILAEISELKVNPSGHCYLELIEKDLKGLSIKAKVKATIWSSTFRMIKPYFETTTHAALTAGIKVMVKTTVELHELYGFSLNVIDIEPSYTIGELAKQRQEIIDRLAAEGVIDMNKQLPFPEIPKRIAVISSKTAAGYGDFCDQLLNNARRYRFYIHLFPAVMQGDNAEQSIINALDRINSFDNLFDVAVIIRGGGAQSELNCFNSYWLAFHVCQFPIPVLTGIGHEQDDTITDLVANTRLKTPTAVAEFLISRFDLAYERISALSLDLADAVNSLIMLERKRLSNLFVLVKPGVSERMIRSEVTLRTMNMKLVGASRRSLTKHSILLNKLQGYLKNNLKNFILGLKHKTRLSKASLRMNCKMYLENLMHKAELLNERNQYLDPYLILKRGYSVTFYKGKTVKTANEVPSDEILETRVYQGKIKSKTL